MKGYNVVCPICGTLNKNLNLEETDGWMECEKCKTAVGVPHYMHKVKVPVYTPEQLALMAKHPASKGKMAFGAVEG